MTDLEYELINLLNKYGMDIKEISIMFNALQNEHKLVIEFEDLDR